MILAKSARSIASIPAILARIERSIMLAANKGKAGVWVEALPHEANKKLKEFGYETTIGAGKCDKGVDRSGKTWIWWGNC